MATYQIHKESMKIPCKVNDIAVISYGDSAIKDLPKFIAKEILPYYNAYIINVTDDYIEMAHGGKFDRITGKFINESDSNPYMLGEAISVIKPHKVGNIEINDYFIEKPKDVMEKILEFRGRGE